MTKKKVQLLAYSDILPKFASRTNKLKMKKVILSLVALLASCAMWAEDAFITFRLNDTQQSEVSYKIGTEVSCIVFKDNQVVLQKDNRVVKTYTESQVGVFSFTSTSTGISLPEFASDDASAAVYSIDGKRLSGLDNIKALPKGVYIIRKGNASYKIVK